MKFYPGATHPDARLPCLGDGRILRFDVPLIYSKLDALRTPRGLTWVEVAGEIGGLCSADQLKNMGKQQRTGFPEVMRLARWLHCPAAALTRIARWWIGFDSGTQVESRTVLASPCCTTAGPSELSATRTLV